MLRTLKQLTDAIEGENDPGRMMKTTVRMLRESLSADCAWLLYPCSPGSHICSLKYFSCADQDWSHFAGNDELAVTPEIREQFNLLLQSEGPLLFRDLEGALCRGLCSRTEGNCSQMLLALKMRNDRAWLLGLCDCLGRNWSTDEQDLFQLVGERLRYAYDTARFLQTVQRDIAKRQKVEAEILRTEQRFRSLFEHSSISLLMLDVRKLLADAGRTLVGEGWKEDTPPDDLEMAKVARLIRVIDINSATLELFSAYDRNHLLSSLSTLLTAESRRGFKDIVLALLFGEKHFSRESELKTLKGDTVAVILNVDMLPPPDDHLLLLSVTDISERKRVEERRRLLSTAVEQSAESVVITDPEGRIEYVNPAYQKVSGFTPGEVLGKIAGVLKKGNLTEYQYRLLWQEIKAGNVWRRKYANRKKDGSPLVEDVVITPVRDDQGNISHFVAVKRDITRREQLEDLVRQSQKMQAIGTLAGGIAHDFNNILTAILGFAELSVVMCGDDPILKNNLNEIITASERAGHLINQILTFSRQTEKNVSSMNLDPIVKEVLKLLRASLPANIEIVPQINCRAMVRADPTQIHQVVMNLCTNAFQAIGENNGTIKVTIDCAEIGGHKGIELGNLPAGEYVTLSVEDNGCGIAPEHLERIFEPYFTTKAKNEGTGLGLSVVHGIVSDHGGAVDVQSTPRKGSCFTVYLPIINEDRVENGEDRAVFLKGSGKILLVDDEQQIVDFEVQTLEKAGYVTRAATSSTEALNIFRNKPRTFDLVITDMAMPELTGVQLFKKLREINRDIPVLLCTGYSEYVSAESSREMGINGYLPKPFTAEQLAAEVYRLLFGNLEDSEEKVDQAKE